jgi:hypothetical protein
MATIFPISASVGQVYGGYEFDGTSWNIIGIDLTADYVEQAELTNHASDTTDVHGITDTSTLATEGYVDTAISNLVDSAPATLDTLNEIAAAINDDANFSASVVNHVTASTNVHGIADTGTLVSGSGITNIVALTQAEYDALTPDPTTLYVVTD